MKYRYDLLILVEVVLLALTPAIFWIALRNPVFVFTRIAIVLIWLLQIGLLYYTMKSSDRDLDRFIRMITNDDDYHLIATNSWYKPRSALLQDINRVITSVRELKSQKESDLLFFRQVMEHTPIGIMAVASDMRVVLINRSASELLGVGHLYHINQIDKRREGLSSWFEKLNDNTPSVLNIDSPSKSMYLSVVATRMKVRDEEIRIFSLKDIKYEVDRKEMETLQRMMRLMSHEVVNSISPISLLAANILKNIKGLPSENRETIGLEKIADIELGLGTIHKRSSDLNDFVGSIRQLTSIPEPVMEHVDIKYLFQQSAGLMKAQLNEKGIELIIEEVDYQVCCDSKLITQVLINLVKNSMEALSSTEDALISLSGTRTEDVIIIGVEDNGPGIPENVRDDVFSPFFSTRKSGSGIGLSFSRQVMSVHNGEINLWSDKNRTIFSLLFPRSACV